jgi:cytidylate kinase
MPVITIRGSYASGSLDIGKAIAARLGVDYIDRQVIAEVATRLRSQEETVLEKEMVPPGIMGRIAEALGRVYPYEGAELPQWEIPLDDTRYLKSLSAVLKQLASLGSVVIHGRGGQFILKDYPESFHVSIGAPLQIRIQRVMEKMQVNEASARQEILRFDNSGREWVKKYFRANSDDPEHYDMMINTAHINFEAATSIILNALSLRYPAIDASIKNK